jgi:alr3663 protein
MRRLSIPASIQKRLYSESAGMCNLCRNRVNELNEVAHIIAHSPNGPRGNSEYNTEFINSYENLILLCPTCHREVDDNPDKFPVDFLMIQKQEHISYVVNQLDRQSVHRNSDIFCIRAFIEYGELNKLAEYIYYLPNSFNTRFITLPSFIDSLLLDIPSALPFNDSKLNNYFEKFYNTYHELCYLLNGFNDKLKYEYKHYPPKPNFITTKFPEAGLNKIYLSDEALNNLCSSIIEKKELFLEQYQNLIRFIKQNYPEISFL